MQQQPSADIVPGDRSVSSPGTSRYSRKLDSGVVECLLCPHHCRMTEGKAGRCRSRRVVEGRLVSMVYGHPCALAIDPIEKKPLYHFHPGTQCLSLACTGCNFRCLNCQNHDISQARPEEVRGADLTPQDIVRICEEHHCPGIAYTYTEPLTYLEYVVDTARLAHEHGLWNILVTAGYVCPEPLADLLPVLDAANVDLKAFSDEVYRQVCGGRLQVVLDTILAMRDAGVALEITNLVIPGINDNMDMIRDMCRWMRSNGLDAVPLHFSRFFPQYRMGHLYPTPVSTLKAARQTALEEGLKHVYLGNVPFSTST